MGKVIYETLGTRSSTYNGYQWYEIISALFDVYQCGGDYVGAVFLFSKNKDNQK